MQRRSFLKSSTTLIGMLPLIEFNQFNFFKQTFLMADEVVAIKIGKLKCTLFRDLMFKYLAKDFFMNANQEELNQSLNKYHIAPDNIPSPFIAALIQQDNKKYSLIPVLGF